LDILRRGCGLTLMGFCPCFFAGLPGSFAV
jgi:hypothetical protein